MRRTPPSRCSSTCRIRRLKQSPGIVSLRSGAGNRDSHGGAGGKEEDDEIPNLSTPRESCESVELHHGAHPMQGLSLKNPNPLPVRLLTSLSPSRLHHERHPLNPPCLLPRAEKGACFTERGFGKAHLRKERGRDSGLGRGQGRHRS